MLHPQLCLNHTSIQIYKLSYPNTNLRHGTSLNGGSVVPRSGICCCHLLLLFVTLQTVQTGSGVHATSYLMRTKVFFLGVKRPVRETVHFQQRGD